MPKRSGGTECYHAVEDSPRAQKNRADYPCCGAGRLIDLRICTFARAGKPLSALKELPAPTADSHVHHCLEEERLGKWVISVSEFENDLKYIQAQGYTTIVVQDLLDHYQKGTPLPEKPIMITIDDGHLSTYTYLYPLLKQYNMKAVLSIVGAYTDEYTETTDTTVSYAYLSWDNVKELSDSGVIEIQNHSYNMHSTKNGHNGISRMGGESDEAYKKRFMEDIGGLQTAIQEHTGRTPTAFTYPFGYINEDSKPYIKELGFQVVFTCEERVNRLRKRLTIFSRLCASTVRTAGLWRISSSISTLRSLEWPPFEAAMNTDAASRQGTLRRGVMLIHVRTSRSDSVYHTLRKK